MRETLLSKKLRDQFKPPKKKRQERLDGLGHRIVPDTLYFVQDARPGAAVGNCALWWKHQASGYSCDLGQAGLFRGDACRNLRNTDILWPEAHVRANTVTHVRADTDALQVREPAITLVDDEEPGGGVGGSGT